MKEIGYYQKRKLTEEMPNSKKSVRIRFCLLQSLKNNVHLQNYLIEIYLVLCYTVSKKKSLSIKRKS